MKNKGFTLVELLAVIVVLGIIALIGYSSVGNIISSSKESSNKLTIKNYAKAVDQAIFLSEMNNKTVEYTSSWLQDNVKFENSKVKCSSITYDKSASLYGCSVNDSTEKYCYNNYESYVCEMSKNLFDYSKEAPIYGYKDNGKFKSENSSLIAISTFTTLQNYIGETVTISFDLTTSDTGTFLIYQYQSNGIGIKFNRIEQSMQANVSQRISMTGPVEVLGTNENYSNGAIVIYKNGYTGSYTVENIQFELNNIATDYEPYGYKEL